MPLDNTPEMSGSFNPQGLFDAIKAREERALAVGKGVAAFFQFTLGEESVEGYALPLDGFRIKVQTESDEASLMIRVCPSGCVKFRDPSGNQRFKNEIQIDGLSSEEALAKIIWAAKELNMPSISKTVGKAIQVFNDAVTLKHLKANFSNPARQGESLPPLNCVIARRMKPDAAIQKTKEF